MKRSWTSSIMMPLAALWIGVFLSVALGGAKLDQPIAAAAADASFWDVADTDSDQKAASRIAFALLPEPVRLHSVDLWSPLSPVVFAPSLRFFAYASPERGPPASA